MCCLGHLLNKRYEKPKAQSRINNSETQYGDRQNKAKTQHRKQKHEQSEPQLNKVFVKGKKFLLLRGHSSSIDVKHQKNFIIILLLFYFANLIVPININIFSFLALKIHISKETRDILHLKNTYEIQARGEINIKVGVM